MNTIITDQRPERPASPIETRIGFAAEAPSDGIPQRRRHFYVYTILLLLTLLIHTVKHFNESISAQGDAELTAEVTKFMKSCDLAKNRL